MSTRSEKKAEKRVCNICYEPVSIKNRSRRHTDEKGNKCGARICKKCMEKILYSYSRTPTCPFCRKLLPRINSESPDKKSGQSIIHLVERVFRLMDEGNSEEALDLLENVDESIFNYKLWIRIKIGELTIENICVKDKLSISGNSDKFVATVAFGGYLKFRSFFS